MTAQSQLLSNIGAELTISHVQRVLQLGITLAWQ